MIVLLTADDGRIESYAALTRENKLKYAQRHGFVYKHAHIGNGLFADLSPAWNLVRSMYLLFEHAPPEFENGWMFFSGADACIVKPELSLESIIANYSTEPQHDLLITEDLNGLNNNGFLLRNTAWGRSFLREIYELRGQTFDIPGPDGHVHQWEEQGAFIVVLGRPEMAEHVVFMPQELTNGYPPEVYGPQYKTPIFMAHFPGKKTEERTYFIKRALGLTAAVPLPEAHWIDRFGKTQGPQ